MKQQQRFKLVRDLAVLLGGQLLSKVVGFAAFVYLARVLDPDAYGAVEYAAGLAVVFGMVIEWGLGPIGVRALAGAPQQLPALTALIPAARLCLSLAAIPVMGACLAWFAADAATARLGWLFALAMLALPWKQDWLLQGLEMMRAAAPAQLIRMSAFALAVVVLVDGARDLVWIGVAEVFAAVVLAAYYLIIQQLWIVPIGLRFALAEIRDLLRQGFSVGSSGMIWTVLQYAPLLLMANLVAGSETGWFAAAHRVVVSLLALSWIYHFNLYPTIARRAQEGQAPLRRLLSASFRVVAWGGIGSALVLTLLARPLLVSAFGADFAAAEPAFAVLIWTLPVTLLSGHARWALIAAGDQSCVLVAHLAGLAVLLVVGIPLTAMLQGVGAGLAMLAGATTVWAVSHVYAAVRLGPLTRLSVAVPPLAVATLNGVLARELATDPLAITAIAATGYALGALLLDRRLPADVRQLADAKSEPRP